MATPNVKPAAASAERPDAAHDIFRSTRRPLDAIFDPKHVAVIGATDRAGSVGRAILMNLIATPFGGTIYPVNPKRDAILGIKAYPDIARVPAKVDLAVFVTPSASIPGLVKDCVTAGVKAGIVISAGFREIGPAGVALEAALHAEARRGGMRLIGPNCLGVMRPPTGFNATFASRLARPGTVGFLSQSGALLTAVLDWSLTTNVGFSAFVSMGTMLDTGWGDMIDYLGNDPATRAIVAYMESVDDPRAFLSAAREVALVKPIILLKAGRSEAAAKAAASHTGALAGSDDVLDAALRRCGVLRVSTISELFHMAEVLGMQPRPKGPRLTIITNAGGPGVLATDSLVANGGQVATVTPATRAALDAFLPAAWSHNNPIDVLGDADAARYAQTLETAAKDADSDGLLVILTPQAMTDATGTAELLKPLAKSTGKPVLASWMGGPEVEAGRQLLSAAGIPAFPYPDTATQIFCDMWRYSENLRALYETPATRIHADGDAHQGSVDQLFAVADKAGRSLLSEFESKALLAAYGIPTVPTAIATTADEAAALATKAGFPVVVKLHSETITHKTDVGGVKLNLRAAADVAQAFRDIEASVEAKAGKGNFLGVTVQPMVAIEGEEIILGMSQDAQFGPVILFGAGGRLVEVFKDRSLALPPLTTTLARRMMERTMIFKALKGVRGRASVDMAALEQLLVDFSELIIDQPRIKELDINPLVAGPGKLLALDARVVLHPAGTAPDKLSRPAIRPYPTQYVSASALKDGSPITLRPIRPEDEPMLVEYHRGLSARTVYQRYFSAMDLNSRTAHERLIRICCNDYDREIALVVEGTDPATKKQAIFAVGRLSKDRMTNDAEFSILVADAWQKHGLGLKLLTSLVRIGKDEGVSRIWADMLGDNMGMQRICAKLGFTMTPQPEEHLMRAELKPA